MIYKIIDPAGFHHTLFEQRGIWDGWENIAHTVEPTKRRALIEQVCFALANERPLPEGFTRAD